MTNMWYVLSAEIVNNVRKLEYYLTKLYTVYVLTIYTA